MKRYEKVLGIWLPIKRAARTLIRLGGLSVCLFCRPAFHISNDAYDGHCFFLLVFYVPSTHFR